MNLGITPNIINQSSFLFRPPPQPSVVLSSTYVVNFLNSPEFLIKHEEYRKKKTSLRPIGEELFDKKQDLFGSSTKAWSAQSTFEKLFLNSNHA
jgi:hypothetical protein